MRPEKNISGHVMPFYEYQCTNCGFEIEELQKMDEKPLKKCEQCGKSTLKKLVSAAVFRLKGSGWYETDFKSGNKKNVVDSNADNKPDNKPDNKTNDSKKKADSGGKSTTAKKATKTKD